MTSCWQRRTPAYCLTEPAGAGRARTSTLRRAFEEDTAQGMVETGLSLLAAATLAFMLFEGIMLIYTYAVLNNAAREGVRYAVVHGTDSTQCSGPSDGCNDASGANVASVVRSYAATSFHDMSGMTVAVNYPDATQSQPLSLITVTVSYNYVPITGFLPISTNLSLTSEGRIVF